MSFLPASSAPASPPRAPGVGASSAASGPPLAGGARLRQPRHLTLPRDARARYLFGTRPLPVPRGELFVHLELSPLRRHPDGARLGRAFWQGLRVESAGSALLGSYLRRCGQDPLRTAGAVSLIQPLEGRPGSDRVVVLWGLLGARRLVACLGDAVVSDGGRTALLGAGGEPGLALERAASDLHLDVLALDGDTLLVASGRTYRAAVRVLAGAGGPPAGTVASIAAEPLFQEAVASAPRDTVLVAMAPRFPRALPHLRLPADVPRNVRQGHLRVVLTPAGLALAVHLRVQGHGRAVRWARRLPGRVGRLHPFVPAVERPFLAALRPSVTGDALRLDLQVIRTALPTFGRAAERWLPW